MAKRDDHAAMRSAIRELTPRQRAVLELRCSGYTNRDAAERLFVGPDTIKNHLTLVYRKMERAVPNARGKHRAGIGYAICYALGGLICHEHND